MWDLAVIGGGASGLILAAEAQEAGLRTVLLEKSDRVGRKLLATGNGRCNLANTDFSLDHYHGSVLPIAKKIFDMFGSAEIEAYWNSLGIDYVEGERGKLYPRSLQASSVQNALRRRIEDVGCEVLTDSQVQKIRTVKDGFILMTEKGNVKAACIAICAGGKASPALGAAGEGYILAKSLGHRIEPLRPAICRLLSDSPYSKRLSGLRMVCPLILKVDGKTVMEEEGEVLFTDEGLSGPPILDFSRLAGGAQMEGRFVQVIMDLASEYEPGQLFGYLSHRLERLAGWTVEDAMEGWLPKKLVVPVLDMACIDRKISAGSLDKRMISKLRDVLKEFSVNIRGVDGFKEAQVTVGGVRGEELHEDLQSKKVPGLYFCGEVTDLDGDCGGYNLMWAAASALCVAASLKTERYTFQ